MKVYLTILFCVFVISAVNAGFIGLGGSSYDQGGDYQHDDHQIDDISLIKVITEASDGGHDDHHPQWSQPVEPTIVKVFSDVGHHHHHHHHVSHEHTVQVIHEVPHHDHHGGEEVKIIKVISEGGHGHGDHSSGWAWSK